MATRTGQCHCGDVRFEMLSEPRDASYCHCSICRKLYGPAFSACVELPEVDLRLLRGSDRMSEYAASARMSRTFCRRCGTSLFTSHADFVGYSYINLGVIDDDDGIVPGYHQFAASGAGWYRIADDLPQFDEWPDEAGNDETL